jgi:ABC-2 type transport system permease protein
VPVALVLPTGFGDASQRAFFGGQGKPTLELLYDPSHSTELAMVRGILTEKVMQTVSKRAFSADTGPHVLQDALGEVDSAELPEDDKRSLKEMLASVQRWEQRQAKKPAAERQASGVEGGLSVPYTTHEQAITSGRDTRYNAYTHSFAGMGVQFVLFAGIEAAVMILTERQRGLWRRLRAAPLSRGVLLGAKAVSGTIIGFGVMVALFLSGMLLFHIRIEGSVLGFLLILAAFGLMSSTFGLLVAALGKTPQAARGLSIFAVLIMVMLGGAWFPTFLFPPTLQKLTVVMPTRWAIDGIDAVTWRGLGLSAAVVPTLVLVGSALVFGLIAVNRFRWDAD